MIRKVTKLIIILASIALITGCAESNRAYRNSSRAVTNTNMAINMAQKSDTSVAPPVVVKKGFYADTTPIAISNNPVWLRRHITLEAKDLSLSFLIKQILRDTNASISYQPGVDTSKPISMHYRGSIKGALESLAQKTNYAYDIDGNRITWSNYVTKTFNISFMPGSSDYLVGQSAGSSNSNSSDTDISTIKGNLDDEQYSNLKGTLSVWKDLNSTLNELKSKDGKVFVSESTTTVTVHDHPANVAAMTKYIKQLNREMSRQVQLRVRVLQVELNRSHKYGIDWNLAEKWFGQHFSFTTSALNTLDTATSGAANNPVSLILGKASSNALISAIGQQGKVSIVTEPSTVTMNNQVAEIRISRDTSYLKKLEQTIVSGTPATTTTSLDPGIVTAGFTLYVLPKIKDNRVFLQISSSMSTLERIDTINSAGQINDTSSSSGSTIQIPTLAEKRFNMRSELQNGSTLIIAGFKQLTDRANQTKVFDSSKLGATGSSRDNIETIILITPTIIENK